jgi:hypothetical protein
MYARRGQEHDLMDSKLSYLAIAPCLAAGGEFAKSFPS